MSKNARHFNLAVLGRSNDGIGDITAAIAKVAAKMGEVISGDYLDGKTLSKRKELFHIRFNTSVYECEYIHVPLYADNISKSVHQSDAVVYIVNIESGISVEDVITLRYIFGHAVNQLIVVFALKQPSGSLDNDLKDLAFLEASGIIGEIGFSVEENRFLFCDVNESSALELAAEILKVVDTQFVPRLYSVDAHPAILDVEKVYHVSDKGLKNAPVAFGFLQTGTLLNGSDVKIAGLSEQTVIARVRGIEIFGQSENRCEPGRTAAILLERVPRDFMEPGHVLVSADYSPQLLHEVFISVWIPEQIAQDPFLYVTNYKQIELFFNASKITAFNSQLTRVSPRELRIQALMQKPVFIHNPNVLVGIGNNVIAGTCQL